MKFLSRNRNAIITLVLIIILAFLLPPITSIIANLLWCSFAGIVGYISARSDTERNIQNET